MELSRRNFLKGAGVVGVATAAAALTGCNQPASMAATGTTNAENDATAEDWLGSAPDLTPESADRTVECEVLVVGSALAGSMAPYGAAQGGA